MKIPFLRKKSSYILKKLSVMMLAVSLFFSAESVSFAQALSVPLQSSGIGNVHAQTALPATIEAADALLESIPDSWPDGPEITSVSALVMEAESGVILYEKDALSTRFPASTTKIMTALLGIENGTLSDVITYSNNAVNTLPLGASHIAIKRGEQLTVEQTLYGVLLPSANECAQALAEYVAGDLDTFARRMNARAKEIGCVNTNFVNPTGLHDDEHTTCAYDLALMMRECIENPTFAAIDGTPTYTLPPTNVNPDEKPIGSTHKMLRTNSTEWYDSRVVGGKTGSTDESGKNLITVAVSGGMKIIVVTLGTEEPNQYSDTKLLMDWAFSSFQMIDAASSDVSLSEMADSSNLMQIPRDGIRLYELAESCRIPVPTGTTMLDLERTVSEQEGMPAVTYFSDGYELGTAKLQRVEQEDENSYADALLREPSGEIRFVSLILIAAVPVLLVLLILIIRRLILDRDRF